MSKILHTYGDSHATKEYGGWNKININDLYIITNHIPGKLMFSFGRDQMIVVGNIKENDIVCFCFGEIDCRCHINNYEPNWETNIDSIVENYFITISKNVKDKNLIVFVFNVVPPVERELPINNWLSVGAGLPALGTDEDRKKYTVYMNKKIKEYCEKFNYVFFDVYDKYIDEKGFLKRELSDTNCHISNPIYIEEFLKKYIYDNR
jgi:hypothetical protein